MNQQEPLATVHACRKPKTLRVNFLSRPHPKVDVPYLRLRGWWLHNAGFTIGRTLKVEVSEGKLVIEAV